MSHLNEYRNAVVHECGEGGMLFRLTCSNKSGFNMCFELGGSSMMLDADVYESDINPESTEQITA